MFIKTKYWLRAVKKEQRYFLIGFIIGLIAPIFWWIFYKPEFEIDFDFIRAFTWAVLTVAIIIASVIHFLVGACPRIFQKRGITPFLYPVCLILLAVFLCICAYFFRPVFYWSVSFLIVGAFFFFLQLFAIIKEETFGATLQERITYESREKKGPFLNEPSPITEKVFQNKIQICKGDAILALCDSIEEGRQLARKIIESGDYGIYVTADRPWTIIREKFKDYRGSLYCIDCFTNVYGLDEFKDAEKFEDATNFYSYTPRPVTIRKLHSALRDIRRRIVSKMLCKEQWSTILSCEKDVWSQLKGKNKKLKKEVEKELGNGEKERKENVKIIYDSVSALASIFDMEDLLKFLIHDTNVDKTIGRNTLLLVKEGVPEENIIKKLESFCEICLKPTRKYRRINIHISKIRNERPPDDFIIDC